MGEAWSVKLLLSWQGACSKMAAEGSSCVSKEVGVFETYQMVMKDQKSLLKFT
jgi:hypothetical protein